MSNPSSQSASPPPAPPSTNNNVLILVIVALVIGCGFMVYTWNANEDRRASNEKMREVDRFIRDNRRK